MWFVIAFVVLLGIAINFPRAKTFFPCRESAAIE